MNPTFDPIKFEVIRNRADRGDGGDDNRASSQRLLDQHQNPRRFFVRLL